MTAPQQQWAWLARIRRPQGRKGEVFADILTDFPEKFVERRRLWLIADAHFPRSRQGTAGTVQLPRQAELQAHWLHKGGVVLHFAGYESISAAETLAGLIVAIPIEERVTLSGDEVYIPDLIGCTLFNVTLDGAHAIGEIEEVDRTAGPVPLLVVRHPDSREEILIPFAKNFLRNLDTAARRVEMALPDGLIDLNAPGK
jgi:16S rRNA processing protein RimM